jgi:uncharacterized protein
MLDHELTQRLVSFARCVREHGVPTSSGQVMSFVDAAARVGPENYYWAGRATLTSASEHVSVYDAAFRTFWALGEVPKRAVPTLPRQAVEHCSGEGGDGVEASKLATPASDVEVLRDKDFETLTDAERALVARAIRRLKRQPPSRVSRRMVSGPSGQLDLRRMAHCSVRTAGVPIRRAWRRRTMAPRRGVFLLDVSASMSQYSRTYLLVAHSMLRAAREWEAFCFSTRLTSVSEALRATNSEEALARVAGQVAAWDDGTRLGDSLQNYLDSYRNRGRVRGATCVICSDGLDVGNPTVLADQMRRMSLLAHRIAWVNPLYDEPGYEPIARGMKAALPYVDLFLGGHDLASFEDLTKMLATA